MAGYIAGALLGFSGLAIAIIAPATSSGHAPIQTTQLADSDGDGIPDIFDGCPGIPNIDAGNDSDGDGVRDECDLDPDGSGIMPLAGAVPLSVRH